ncbi:MAG: MFS transporter [Acidobacteriia bacterium]|nr:MFS transporter [Terriglobia bacterium]
MRAVLQQPDFRKLWLAQFVSIFGDFLALFGFISLIAFRWHGNALQVTLVMVAYMVPMALVGPLAGVFVDRWNVKRVMIASDLLRAILILLAVFARNVPQLCVIFGMLGVFSSFFAPAQSVTVRTLVPVEKLLAANAMMSQAFFTVRLVSPLLAGALIAWLGENPCFYLDAASFAFSALMVSTLAINPPRPSGKSVQGFLSEFSSGNRFIFTHAYLAFVVTAMVVAMFVLSCFSPLISIYVRDMLRGGTLLYGFVSTMIGVGLMLGTQGVTRFARQRSKKDIVLVGLLTLGFSTGLLAAFANIPMAAASMFGLGLAIALVIVPAQTLMQQETPHAMIGRVSSSFMSLISLAQVTGLLLSGYLAHLLGIRQLFLTAAVALALITVVGYTKRGEAPQQVATEPEG